MKSYVPDRSSYPPRIPCVLVVAVQATGSYAVGVVVAHKPPRNQKALRRSKMAAATTPGNMDTDEDVVDVGADHNP